MREYEGLFLLDANAAARDWDATAALVDGILQKHGARTVRKERWDERKLSYEIRKHKRGAYYLVYFQAAGEAIEKIRADCRLTEGILRQMILVLDEPVEQFVAARAAERERLAASSGTGRDGEPVASGPGGPRVEARPDEERGDA